MIKYYDEFIKHGAIEKKLKKNEVIFNEGESALFFYLIVDGTIRMFNRNEEGKEFVQGYFSSGQSFGEPPLFIDENYPTTAACMKDSIVLKLSKNKFFKMLEDLPELQTLFIKILSKRIIGKAKSSKDIINQNTEQKIISFLMIQKPEDIQEKIFIPFTRQEIANFTGLRVETVIRACSKLKKTGVIDIINHKIYF
ncbi:Crp/Fnr family transcriptional regulator [Flavobacterium columnare]|uniref:Crp/Fnr family transcriptional regulator n=1 Tax=Flavobacterium columnare TaxID=996 RepID=A0A437U913_9FLAO|nr:Crp/Fnr family transcriptional regulator [Flavobacterium columnare]RVU90085.1 Crp/Fnr family transcriptional regulator [Flavobacterium columnare]